MFNKKAQHKGPCRLIYTTIKHEQAHLRNQHGPCRDLKQMGMLEYVKHGNKRIKRGFSVKRKATYKYLFSTLLNLKFLILLLQPHSLKTPLKFKRKA